MRALGGIVLALGLLAGEAGGLRAQAPARAEEPVTFAPLSPFLRRKAEVTLREQLPCLGCHTLNGEGGAVGPDLSTVRARRSAAYVVAMLRNPEDVVPGSAMPSPMLADGTRELIARYLSAPAGGGAAAGAARAPAAGRAASTGSDVSGARAASPRAGNAAAPGAGDRSAPALYARYCAACHGTSGRGDGPNAARLPVPPANHASRAAMSARPDDSLFDTIYGGGAIMNRSPRMPAYGATLSRAEIRALVRHIRTLCGCEGPAWSRDGRGGNR